MNQLKKYLELSKLITESNDIDKIYDLKKEADIIIEKYISKLKNDKYINELNNITFGDAKDIFEHISAELFKSNDGRKYIHRYISTISENASLLDSYILHENIKSANSDNARLLINESISLININKSEYKNGMVSLIKLIKESLNYLKTNSEEVNNILSNGNKELNESIDFILKNKKTLKNVSTYTDKLNTIYSSINNIKSISENNINNENIEQKIDENKNIIDKSTIFENYKNDCLNIIDDIISKTSNNEKICEIKDKLKEKIYNDKTIDNDLLNLIELKNTLLKQ